MAADTPEIRTELVAAWQAVADRLLNCGYARAAVAETMVDVALAELDSLYGVQEATHVILKTRSRQRRVGEPAPRRAVG